MPLILLFELVVPVQVKNVRSIVTVVKFGDIVERCLRVVGAIFPAKLDGNLIGIELPQSVILEIVETAPAIKGASASARTKPATCSTGLVVQVPEYLTPGEVVKVNTDTGEFVSRA